ncbi:uncharacterized protein CCOS01_08312 [Colletotrichum costaricense]|uniref:Uncharacterized protein n=1 Tax=Colletotrichum costaricense TaxID=1209916 RepID=A0AAJ0E081_9PEZI|nr:uncharacterized protein CCOS01_08312 [Colletotrichum costaricense]KAK1525894.1 hypothetical protein CCOS01_08312 [Colletotrichum costaricense]
MQKPGTPVPVGCNGQSPNRPKNRFPIQGKDMRRLGLALGALPALPSPSSLLATAPRSPQPSRTMLIPASGIPAPPQRGGAAFQSCPPPHL